MYFIIINILSESMVNPLFDSTFERSSVSLEENLKKAITELLVLSLLARHECYIGELTDIIREKSHGDLNIVFPYAAIYRMLDDEYIMEAKKRIAPDGRRRQYYQITEKGRKHLDLMLKVYQRFSQCVAGILADGGQQE